MGKPLGKSTLWRRVARPQTSGPGCCHLRLPKRRSRKTAATTICRLLYPARSDFVDRSDGEKADLSECSTDCSSHRWFCGTVAKRLNQTLQIGLNKKITPKTSYWLLPFVRSFGVSLCLSQGSLCFNLYFKFRGNQAGNDDKTHGWFVFCQNSCKRRTDSS